ncbi:hypothetical protein [Nocardioides nitrophenolicus]|uniref:hypothetical protein n=1 Tax=Nocardioides nitrophenolicus TaxID=60489 RepID=UPI000AB1E42B|nr:hypothetical protein [Nocardioides nitrophenolicus]MBM7519189.1 hypothetical protein [Nocardioides nitrophenolicus]
MDLFDGLEAVRWCGRRARDIVALGLFLWILVDRESFVDVFMAAAAHRAEGIAETFIDTLPLPGD